MHYVKTDRHPRSEYVPLPWLTGQQAAQAVIWPAIDSVTHSFRSNDRPRIDSRRVPQPPFTWFYPITDATTQSWVPTWYQEMGYRSRDKAKIDVTSIIEPPFTWANPVIDAVVASYSPIFSEELAGYRSQPPTILDVRRVNEPDFNWIFRPLNFDSQWWPGVEELLRAFRTPAGSVLDVRNVPEPGFAWDFAVVDTDLATKIPPIYEQTNAPQPGKARALDVRDVRDPGFGWIFNYLPVSPYDNSMWPAIEELLRSFRSLEAKKLWPDVNQPLPAWLFQVVDADLAVTLAPLFNGGYRTRDSAKLWPINEPDVSWIFQNLPAGPAFDQTLWPAIEELLRAVRTPNGAMLDVRSVAEPAFTWFYSLVEVLAPSAFDRRTPEGLKLDVRKIDPGQPAWIFQNLPTPSVYDNTMWPAIEELLRAFRTLDPKRLDPRLVNEPDLSAWVLQAAEMFAISNGGDRTADAPRINVRAIAQPNIDWIFNTLQPAFDPQIWPAIEELLRSYRSKDSAIIDVRTITEPPFTWPYPVTDAITAQLWPAIEELLRALRSRDGDKLNVRSINEPSDAWLAALGLVDVVVNLRSPKYFVHSTHRKRGHRA